MMDVITNRRKLPTEKTGITNSSIHVNAYFFIVQNNQVKNQFKKA
jgi:ribosomal protein L23